MSDHTAKWDARDRQRAEHDTLMAQEREQHRQTHIAIVEAGLADGWPGLSFAHLIATIAVDALLADDVVFARMGPDTTTTGAN